MMYKGRDMNLVKRIICYFRGHVEGAWYGTYAICDRCGEKIPIRWIFKDID